jgi:imidazolonepropionase
LRGRPAPRLGPSLNDIGVIADGAVLIRDGLLVEVGPSRRVENLAEARHAVEINAAGRVVMPGFIDSHTHLASPPAGIRTRDEAAATSALRSATGQRLELRARAFLDAMARHGTTTVEVKLGCAPDDAAEAKLIRLVAAVRNDPLDVIASYLFRLPALAVPDALTSIAGRAALSVLPKIRRRHGADFADLAWNPDPAMLPSFERYLAAARDLGFPRRLHASGPGISEAIALALRYGVAGMDHLECATSADARQIGAAGIIATLLPGVSLHSGAEPPPARALIDAGAPIALGTNFNPHQAPMLNMQTVVSLACWRFGMSLEEAISAATINGAYALGCAARTGSLEPGKSADLVILNAEDYRDLSSSIGTNLVHLTMKRGKFIYKEGEVAPRSPQIASQPW